MHSTDSVQDSLLATWNFHRLSCTFACATLLFGVLWEISMSHGITSCYLHKAHTKAIAQQSFPLPCLDLCTSFCARIKATMRITSSLKCTRSFLLAHEGRYTGQGRLHGLVICAVPFLLHANRGKQMNDIFSEQYFVFCLFSQHILHSSSQQHFVHIFWRINRSNHQTHLMFDLPCVHPCTKESMVSWSSNGVFPCSLDDTGVILVLPVVHTGEQGLMEQQESFFLFPHDTDLIHTLLVVQPG